MHKKGWRDWYHCTVGTYATWLPGDPRGWRERDHHEHVEGDYKNPPKPSKFAAGRWQHSKDVMQGEPYLIPERDREPIGRLLLESFRNQRLPLLAMAVTINNFHVLLQCRDGRLKKALGMAKRHVTFSFAPVIADGTRRRQRPWEKEGGVKPIRDRAHGQNAFQYILDHLKEGAWVWSYRLRE